jgi:hypothetical protein
METGNKSVVIFFPYLGGLGFLFPFKSTTEEVLEKNSSILLACTRNSTYPI